MFINFLGEILLTGSYKIAILGASGYTGAELIRLIATHPSFCVGALSADRKAGMSVEKVFPHLRHLKLPNLIKIEQIDFDSIDLVFCALPHATSQKVVKSLPKHLKVVDLSADFRIRDPKVYEKWYGKPHDALDLQKHAVYGLTEYYREDIRGANLVACTGCNAATGLYPLLPLIEDSVIDLDDIIIDLATGVSGAGRSPSEAILHSEVSEGFHAYNVAKHRHTAEFDQEFSKVAKRQVEVTFTPHLLPQNRGILATIYVKGDADQVHESLVKKYNDEYFISILPLGESPATRHVRGSNFVHIGVVADRRSGRCRVFSTLDNLTKGSAGQAIQNANLMLGIKEDSGLLMAPLFP